MGEVVGDGRGGERFADDRSVALRQWEASAVICAADRPHRGATRERHIASHRRPMAGKVKLLRRARMRLARRAYQG